MNSQTDPVMVYIYDMGTWLLYIPMCLTCTDFTETQKFLSTQYSSLLGYELFKYICVDPANDQKGLLLQNETGVTYPLVCLKYINKKQIIIANSTDVPQYDFAHVNVNNHQILYEAWSYCDLAYLPSCGIVM